MVKHIKVSSSLFSVQVDDDLFDYLNQFRWFLSRGYACRQASSRKIIKMHHEVLGLRGIDIADKLTDHRDNNKLNNQTLNLRAATKSQNEINKKLNSRNTSGKKGVSWFKAGKKWKATIGYQGRTIHLGCYEDPIDAARAYDDKARELFGDFALLNF